MPHAKRTEEAGEQFEGSLTWGIVGIMTSMFSKVSKVFHQPQLLSHPITFALSGKCTIATQWWSRGVMGRIEDASLQPISLPCQSSGRIRDRQDRHRVQGE